MQFVLIGVPFCCVEGHFHTFEARLGQLVGRELRAANTLTFHSVNRSVFPGIGTAAWPAVRCLLRPCCVGFVVGRGFDGGGRQQERGQFGGTAVEAHSSVVMHARSKGSNRGAYREDGRWLCSHACRKRPSSRIAPWMRCAGSAQVASSDRQRSLFSLFTIFRCSATRFGESIVERLFYISRCCCTGSFHCTFHPADGCEGEERLKPVLHLVELVVGAVSAS